MTWTPCIDCGEPSPTTRCPDHTKPDVRGTATQRGYDSTWAALSRRARRMQPFCTDCGARDDLTVDHTPEAWARRERGLVIRLQDVDVCCRSCNARRGRARPRGEGAQASALEPLVKAQFGSHTAALMSTPRARKLYREQLAESSDAKDYPGHQPSDPPAYGGQFVCALRDDLCTGWNQRERGEYPPCESCRSAGCSVLTCDVQGHQDPESYDPSEPCPVFPSAHGEIKA